MKILAIETATEACSVALSIDGEIIERYLVAPRQHSQLILPMVESIVAEAQLGIGQMDVLSFGCGPGSFTGVRIAAGVIQGIALGADLPVVPVSTLAALAQNIFDERKGSAVFSALDARMGEVYWGVYTRNTDGWANLWGIEAVVCCSQVKFPHHLSGVGVGSGWDKYHQELKSCLRSNVSTVIPGFFPRARAVVRLAVKGIAESKLVPAEKALPVYLRDQVARKSI